MKVAITSQGEKMDSMVDKRFGRAKWFIVVDTETGDYQAVSNEQNLNAGQGAGIQAAENVSRYDVKAVITGHCGPKAFKTLKAAGIKIFNGAGGTVSEAFDKFKKGEFAETAGADVEGHWL
jgi:predicted Fe-Mo cluster-binding NifX family protein